MKNKHKMLIFFVYHNFPQIFGNTPKLKFYNEFVRKVIDEKETKNGLWKLDKLYTPNIYKKQNYRYEVIYKINMI